MTPDVFIVGGGPAGSALALRLARLGHSVTLAERSVFDRPRAGEALHRGAFATFAALGIQPPSLRVSRTLVRWSGEVEVAAHEGLVVERPQFDRHLLELARNAGVRVLQPRAVDAMPDARFVVDASGRASWSRGSRTRTGVPTTALATHYRRGPLEPRVEAMKNGWLWGSPLPDGRFSVMAFVEDPGASLDAMLAESELFCELRGERSELRHHDATTYACDSPWDERLLRIGEASFSLDPLSSSGVHAALQSAIHASAALHTTLLHPERETLARRFVIDAQRAAVQQHREWTASFYAQSRFASRPFYVRRTVSREDQPPLAVPRSLRLSPEVTITEVPCLVNDLIEARRGVVHSRVARPFVWIGGREVATLLAPLEHGPRDAGELARAWGPPMLETLLRNHLVLPA